MSSLSAFLKRNREKFLLLPNGTSIFYQFPLAFFPLACQNTRQICQLTTTTSSANQSCRYILSITYAEKKLLFTVIMTKLEVSLSCGQGVHRFSLEEVKNEHLPSSIDQKRCIFYFLKQTAILNYESEFNLLLKMKVLTFLAYR